MSVVLCPACDIAERDSAIGDWPGSPQQAYHRHAVIAMVRIASRHAAMFCGA
jgi:hypothetical protein